MAGTKIIGDVLGVIGLPVSAEEPMPAQGATPEQLERNLIEQGEFSAVAEKDIARRARRLNMR